MTLSTPASRKRREMSLARRVLRVTLALLGWVVAVTLPVYAHGGSAAASVIAPPLFTAGAVGLVVYWLIVLWPLHDREAEAQGAQTRFPDLVGGREMERLDEEKSSSHLRAIEGGYNDSALNR